MCLPRGASFSNLHKSTIWASSGLTWGEGLSIFSILNIKERVQGKEAKQSFTAFANVTSMVSVRHCNHVSHPPSRAQINMPPFISQGAWCTKVASGQSSKTPFDPTPALKRPPRKHSGAAAAGLGLRWLIIEEPFLSCAYMMILLQAPGEGWWGRDDVSAGQTDCFWNQSTLREDRAGPPRHTVWIQSSLLPFFPWGCKDPKL